jgi:hypothetical protein
MYDDNPRHPTSDRGGHSLDANCTSGLSPPDTNDIEDEITALINELAALTAELFTNGKLTPTPTHDQPTKN